MNKTDFILKIKSISKYKLLAAVLLIFISNSLFSQVLYSTGNVIMYSENNIAIIDDASVKEILQDNHIVEDKKEIDNKNSAFSNKVKKILLSKKQIDAPEKKKVEKLSRSIKKQTSDCFVIPSGNNSNTSFVYLSISEKACVTVNFKKHQLARLLEYNLHINKFFYSASGYLKYQVDSNSEKFSQNFSIRPPPISSFVNG